MRYAMKVSMQILSLICVLIAKQNAKHATMDLLVRLVNQATSTGVINATLHALTVLIKITPIMNVQIAWSNAKHAKMILNVCLVMMRLLRAICQINYVILVLI